MIMRGILTAVFSLIAIIIGIAPAAAQGTKCMPRGVLVADLSQNYNEHLEGGGMQNPQQLLEVWTNPENGSFTVFITRADGMSCIMATGKHWNSNASIAPAGIKS